MGFLAIVVIAVSLALVGILGTVAYQVILVIQE